ncbi:MAG: hypothetical protein CBB88_02155 [Rhizobiales bacterium TMED28]|nr:hypothetical protein [Rhodobiaceae bacterium]OUT83245.1 MAG: hypothetical protein CBB88_02155 [Rhizobiales bacterium TMED28]
MQKILLIIGLIFISAALLYPFLKKIGLGRLPGDLFFKFGNSSFYFPIVTCIIISIVLTIIINLMK